MLTRPRRVAAALAVASIAVVASGCGTGFNAQTNAVYQAGVGTNNRSADVDLLNVLFVQNDDGSATLSAGLVNQTRDRDTLLSVEAVTLAGTPVDVTMDKTVPVAPLRLTTLGTKTQVLIDGDLSAGQFLDLTFTFENAGTVEVQAPIVLRVPLYDSVAEPPAPAEDAEATAEEEAAAVEEEAAAEQEAEAAEDDAPTEEEDTPQER
ncbi:hypothetical protein CLV56_1329 [Mumia flava]|uniref:Copper(I)-binding protein n=1 Tax=Mumia flava TaxID=1348852 RepID=A0A2M9BGM7_9ACTN|nr:hypothetical protein [Mumia flava]PJJ57108.1 hypothetical protein CLV56_1329 [Mumia flava]